MSEEQATEKRKRSKATGEVVMTRMQKTHKEFVQRAAAKIGKQMNVFVREILLAASSDALGEEIPTAEPLTTRAGGSSPYAAAARAAGLSVKEFKKRAIEAALSRGL